MDGDDTWSIDDSFDVIFFEWKVEKKSIISQSRVSEEKTRASERASEL